MTNMDRNVVGDAVKTMKLALRLERKIIGVRLLFGPESFDGADAKAVKGRMPYCVMVRNAMAGKKLKA